MARRTPALPNLKTIGEQGVAGVEAYTWGRPPRAARHIGGDRRPVEAELLKSLEDPEDARKISGLGYESSPSSPAELAVRTAAELKKWTEVAKAADVKPD
ncbi:MAG: hypothetical protein KIS73_01760 [Enhydrobacter sp.]|nr:hypothetical protein [Enhydrobacter sp.]